MTEHPSRTVRRVNQTVSATTSRIASHRTALGLLVAAAGIFLAYIGWISVNGPPFQDRYELKAIVPSDSPILKTGGAVRIAGKVAGTITDVEPEEEGVEISMELRPDYAPVGEDARASVRVRSIVYLTYLEITPGDRDNPMPEGGTIPLAQTESGVDLLEVVQLFDEQTRATLRRSLVNLGYGFAGRGTQLNAGLATLDETLELATPQLDALTPRPGELGGLISGAAAVNRGLRGVRSDDVAGLIASGDAVLGAAASRSAELGEAIELLPGVQRELLATGPLLDPVLADAEALARELAPAARRLQKGAPQIARLLARGRPLRRETNKLSRLANPVLELGRPVIYDLYPTVASLEPLITALDESVANLEPYEHEITLSGLWATSATSHFYPEGQNHPNNPALRFVTVLGCHTNRDPFPEPGEALTQAQAC
jgi:ABC-type transporter Mla subunit MlaD